MNTQKSIILSAADSCSQPSSIRSMDHLPSRDHKGAEYKESFMFSNRSSVTRSCSIAAATLAVVACLGLASTASAAIIYQDNFSGNSNLGTLNGSAPTVDNGTSKTWTASSSSSYGWSDSGYGLTSNGNTARQNAYLSFTPVNGQIYTLSAGLDLTSEGPVAGGQPDSGYWLAIGFITTPTLNTGYDNNYASPWALSRYNASGGSFFVGPGVNNGGASFTNTAGINNIAIVLNTGTSLWSYQVYLTNSSVTHELVASSATAGAFKSNPAITAVGIEDGYGVAQVSNFELTSSPVPEPATLGLVAVGGLGLLFLRRRKAV